MTTPTRTGKIARLPHKLRERLNTRLKNGESARTLIAWLNARSDVKAILKEHFDSQPIRESNLSLWRHGGYQDWLHQQNSRDLSQTINGDHTAWDHAPLPGALNHWLATHHTLTTRRIVELAQTDPDASYKLLRQMTRDIALLQRSDTLARREQRQRDHQTFHESQAAERTAQLRQKTDLLRQQTEADHERWALHPDNHDHLEALWKKAYPEDYADNSGDNSDEDSDEDTEDDSTPHSQSGPTAGTPNAVTLSEVEGPHTFAPASPASSYPHTHKHSPLVPTDDPDVSVVFDHTSGTFIPIDLDAETSPDTSTATNASASTSANLHHDILDHLQSLEARLKANPSYRPLRNTPEADTTLYFDPWFIRGQRIRDGLDPETGELPPSRRPSKLPPPVSPSEAAVRKLLGESAFLPSTPPQ